MKNKKNILLCLGLVLICLLVLYLVYNAVDTRDLRKIRTQRIYHGDMETPVKKWLNGHLGVFFKFKYLGNINWLALPLLAWFLLDGRKRGKHGGVKRWQGALVFVWLMTTLLIAVKGYYNTRYQLTLFPFTTAMVLFLLWQLLQGKKNLSKILCLSFLGLMCVYNIYHYGDRYGFFWETKVSLEKPHFPYKLVDYLNSNKNINNRSKVFTFNQPLFYYHTSKKGIDYENPYAVDALVEFKKKAGRRGKIYRMLKKQYNVSYILLSANHQRFRRATMLGEFLHCECKLVVEDQGRRLYRLRDKPLLAQLKSPAHRAIKLWSDGASAPVSTVNEISPPLLRFYKYGLFKFRVSKNKGKKSIIVRNTGGKKDKKRRIHFGYEFTRKGLDVDPALLAGRYVNFVVRAAISPKLARADNYISVSDYKNKTWSSEKVYFLSHHWRTYLVSKKVRPGVERLLLMFRFCPQSKKDLLRIKDVKVVISEKPL